MKLISMTEFIIQQQSNLGIGGNTYQCFTEKVTAYANFLKQPLTLWMFIPFDEDGNVFNGRPLSSASGQEWDRWEKEQSIFKQEKERVLFGGFHVIGVGEDYYHIQLKNANLWIVFYNGKICLEYSFNEETIIYTIEDLIEYNLTLTDSAIKQLWV